ncbi:hypothetical protein QE375_001594 [Microbacterium foliorum]|uniref:Uncharacterized protein n=1 Tax=Microbacterium foliorum TaxID=104336 RepID=A0ABU1HPS5_9MICO|nr:hypothetical protein [Microbacterium foliorum]MDR6142040.1 hypothetical protein [Microbacterium foliorum]
MSWGDSFWFPHTVSVRAHLGDGGRGPRYAAATDASAEVLDKQERIRDAKGVEVVSSSRVTVPINTVAPLGSLVTVWPGRPTQREAEVLQVGIDENDPPLPSHLVLWLK